MFCYFVDLLINSKKCGVYVYKKKKKKNNHNTNKPTKELVKVLR